MTAVTADQATALARKLIAFLETGEAPGGLFAAELFFDFTPPLWRIQTQGVADAVQLWRSGHPGMGEVSRWRCDPTPTGFVLEVEERWIADGKPWYCRELMRADVVGDEIAQLTMYCTGHWTAERAAQHAREVRLLRP